MRRIIKINLFATITKKQNQLSDCFSKPIILFPLFNHNILVLKNPIIILEKN